MASLDGLGLQASFRLVNAESGACRAFRVPQREGPAGGAALRCRAASFQSSAAAPGAIAAHACPEERVPVVLPAPGTAHRAGHAGRWPTTWPLSRDVSGG